MAVNWFSVPRKTCELAGVTAIETSTALVTVNVLLPETFDNAAVIVEDPVA